MVLYINIVKIYMYLYLISLNTYFLKRSAAYQIEKKAYLLSTDPGVLFSSAIFLLVSVHSQFSWGTRSKGNNAAFVSMTEIEKSV